MAVLSPMLSLDKNIEEERLLGYKAELY